MAAPKYFSFLVIEGDSYIINKSLKSLSLPEDVEVRYFTHAEMKTDEAAEKFIDGSEVLIVDVMMKELADYSLELMKKNSRKRIYALRGSRMDLLLKTKGLIFDKAVASYYTNITVENIQNLILRVIHQEHDASVVYEEPDILPKAGFVHPEADMLFTTYQNYMDWYSNQPGYRSSNPVIGLMFYSSSLMDGQSGKIAGVIHELEKQGFNVLPAFGRDERIITDLFIDNATSKSRVDVVLTFSLKFYSGLNKKIHDGIRRLDVPFFNAIHLYAGSISEWRKDPVGIPPSDVVWKLANPEISGVIEPTPISGSEKEIDPLSGKEVNIHYVIPENLKRVIPRLKNQVKLRRKSNQAKKNALMYYNHSPGKQNIGASYLNVFRSIEVILKRMMKEGYQVDTEKDISEEKIQKMILLTGRNVGSWAPGELEKMIRNGSVIKVPVKEYAKWFNTLPEIFRQNVVKQWGHPKNAKIMVKEGHFIIPGVNLGNIVMLPEPSRGWSDDPMKLYHDPLVYPHHQYIAAYLFLQHTFKADAMIHLGTHATYEWLPGKQAGLSPACPPEVMVSDIPNIYPYIVDDVGEGIQAKRRGRGVIIDHLTPSLKEGGLYHEYGKLYSLINDYRRSAAKGASVATVKREEIAALVEKTGIKTDISSNHTHQNGHSQPHQHSHTDDEVQIGIDNETLDALEHYLLELKSNLMPYGVHTFGVSPSEMESSDTVDCIAKRNTKADKKFLMTGLKKSGQYEIDSLIAALNGRYIRPGEGNDPVRNPSALPTGKNFYGFSPIKVPSPAAWELGKKAANDIIKKRLHEENKYPEKVAVVLWATETIRNEGINESTILYLMGMKPKWDAGGRVTGTDVIPALVLKRLRIDVLINPSGLYRDLFPDRLLLLDKALQKAILQTDIENLIRKNSVRIKQKLVESGMDEDKAEIMSHLRIFTEKPGSYGNGVSEMTGASNFWKSDDEIVQVYEKRMGFAFGAGKWGDEAKDAFIENLKVVDTAVHSRSSAIYATMDNDDMFQYLGGLSLAVTKESGKSPSTLISRQATPDSIEVENVEKTIGRELRTRYLNPKWIKGMQEEKYAGAHAMAEFAENMWGWQVTVPDSIDAAKWEQTFEVYVEDKYGLEMKQFFNRDNPWAYQSMTGRMLEVVRKDYWKAEERVKKELAKAYAINVVQKGVACCDHTCNNPLLNQMVVSIISLPGVMSPEMVAQFKIAVETAAGKTIENQADQLDSLHKTVTAGFDKELIKKEESQKQTENKASAKGDKAVKGYKMEKIKTDDKSSEVVSSGVQWFASLFVIMLIGFFVYGATGQNRNRLN